MVNLSLDIGGYERSFGWTENPKKLEKNKWSGQAHCGLSKSTWKSYNTQEMSEIYFSSQID